MSGLLETINRTSSAQKLLVLIGLMALISVGFYLLIYDDLEQAITVQATQKDTLLQQTRTIKLKVQNKDELASKLANLRGRKDQIEKVLPAKAEIPKLLQKIYGQGKIVGLSIQKFEPLSEKPRKLYTDIPVSMSLEGSYDQIADFFYYVGRMERVVNIQEISMKRKSKNAGDLSVSRRPLRPRAHPR